MEFLNYWILQELAKKFWYLVLNLLFVVCVIYHFMDFRYNSSVQKKFISQSILSISIFIVGRYTLSYFIFVTLYLPNFSEFVFYLSKNYSWYIWIVLKKCFFDVNDCVIEISPVYNFNYKSIVSELNIRVKIYVFTLIW